MDDRRPSPAADRRQFLLGMGAAVGGASLLGACGGRETAAGSAVPADRANSAGFIVHSEWCWETPRPLTGGPITPTGRVFVRNNVAVPDRAILADREGWQLSVAGVRRPRSLTLAELGRLGVTTVGAVLQCSGNGRAYFSHGAQGSQWGVGAAANVLWTGVPVRAVVEALGGVEDGARFLTAAGADRLEGLDPLQFGVERSIPIDKALADCLLAWEMNAEPLSLLHGGPLRLIVPGYYGINNIKYLDRLAFTAAESENRYQRSSYRVRPVGEGSSPEQPTMWSMNVKSWITAPLGDADLPAGTLQILGVAFGGEAPVASVEVTTDGGRQWHPASLFGPDLGPFAWRTFRFRFDAGPGTHVLASRARDAQGNMQPESHTPNERGYGNNSWRDPAVRLTVI